MAGNRREESRPGEGCRTTITQDGPYCVTGNVPLRKEIILVDENSGAVAYGKGEEYPLKDNYTLCRCGRSKTMPYCDSTHEKVRFDGTETASRKNYVDMAKVLPGPSLVMRDAQALCASARFCHGKGRVWELIQDSDNPSAKKVLKEEVLLCPSGRLVLYDKKTGKQIEPDLAPSISLIEDPAEGVSGPIWVKGGIPIYSADGTQYEIRNRVTLCRCGKSANKPFCDSTHIEAKFRDDNKQVAKK